MITLADIRDWVKKLGVGDNFYIGKLDNKKDKSIGVYQRERSGNPITAIGGRQNQKYDVKPISVLVHWNNNAKDTEETALMLFEKLKYVTDLKIGETHINYIALLVPEPRDVGTDDSGIYERVIWLDLYYER